MAFDISAFPLNTQLDIQIGGIDYETANGLKTISTVGALHIIRTKSTFDRQPERMNIDKHQSFTIERNYF